MHNEDTDLKMKVNLPLAFPVVIRFIIYRDTLCIFLFSALNGSKRVFNFRLSPDFWFDPASQIEYVLQFIKIIEKELDITLLLNGKIIPSDLSSNITSYELIIRQDKGLVPEILDFFDVILERNFQGFSPVLEAFKEDNYIYIDYDVDFFGVFASTNQRKVGGYWNLGYLFYEKIQLSSFLETSVFDLDVRSTKRVLGAVTGQIEGILQKQNLTFANFSKLYLGGVTSEYLDVKNTAVSIKDDLEIVEDNHFELLLNSA